MRETILGSETVSSFFTADIRSPFSLLMSLRSARLSESGCRAPDLGDTWRFGCPKSSMWESGEAWSEDESVPSGVSGENSVCNEALHVIGLYGSGGQGLSFLAGLGACEGGVKVSHGPGHAVPGNA